jgi:hypothetical protein
MLVRTLQNQIEDLKKQNKDLQDRRAVDQSNLAAFENDRRKFKDLLQVFLKNKCLILCQAEDRIRAKHYKEQLEKQEQDLIRIRRMRDEYQSQLNQLQSKQNIELNHINELKIMANNRKDRINALELRIERFKLSIAAGNGDRELVQFFLENSPLGNDDLETGNPIVYYKDQLRFWIL